MADEIVSLAELKPLDSNARQRTQRSAGMIVDSIHEVGAARSGVIDEDYSILAGNGTADALAEAGITKVRVVETDGNEWVVVKRTGLSDEQKRKLALFDNRTAELSFWDVEALLKEAEEIDLSGMWADGELEEMFSEDEARAGGEYDESVADGLELKARFTVVCPQEAGPKVQEAIEDLQRQLPELTWKADETV